MAKYEKIHQLEKLRKQRVTVLLGSGEEIICIPRSRMEEDYPAYLVELAEPFGEYQVGQPMEIREDEIQSITS
ncbi:MAG: hypothetical protein ACYCVD_04175 [Desulfitobacteriaceae bacterium]